MRRKLLETALGAEPGQDQNLTIFVDNLCSEWGSVPVPQLSVMLLFLRFLALVHQTHHWTAKGDPFYGDHLMFDRLYTAIVEEVDSIGERAVGMGVVQNVDMALQTTQLLKLVQGQSMQQTIPQPTMLAKQSLAAELMFLTAVEHLVGEMREAGTMSPGLGNLVAGIQDKHESHVYLLKQRTQSETM